MKGMAKRYKNQCMVLVIALAVILFCLYLRALFLPGLWHGDTFLKKTDDGSFEGTDIYADYKMMIKSVDYGADIEFSVNGNIKHYQIEYDENDFNRNVQISENGDKIFEGIAYGSDKDWILLDKEFESAGEIIFHDGNYIPSEDELFPGCTELYSWAVREENDIRGNAYMLFFILIMAIILFLDIKFPNLFWLLEHRLDVYGGEPSDYYLFGQKVGRVVLLVGILICMVLTFTLH